MTAINEGALNLQVEGAAVARDKGSLRVLIVEDHPVMREGFTLSIQTYGDLLRDLSSISDVRGVEA
ncbi:hypothetical protein [Dyella sp. Tek66A03]|jgi:hypothetical protein|uniref:hypothetical protein n=1 Tax=Dyella sp. Tek66A03 TaxID=3458298 RepID=UPI00403E3EF3